jgi:UDP-glucuronate 4-epimerase
MKVLVTGAAGFIGSHVVDALVARGAAVIGLDSLDPGVHRAVPEYLNPKADYCFSDLRTFQPDERFADVEGIVHLAALGGVSRAAREPANIIQANHAPFAAHCAGQQLQHLWKQLPVPLSELQRGIRRAPRGSKPGTR